MKTKYILKSAFTSLRANKSRTILTILGIVIGITSIILIMSIGQGAQSIILNQVKSMGGNFVQINPGREPQGPMDMVDSLLMDSLKEREIQALKNKNNVPDLLDITPSVIVPGSVSYQGETFKPVIFGWTADWLAKLYNIYPNEGNFFDENDIKSLAKVAVIGSEVKKELFPSSSPIGEKIKIKDERFRIIGTLPPSGQLSGFALDKIVIIPYTTAQKYLLGIDYYQEVHVMAKSENLVPQMVEDIKATLRDLHNIKDSKDDDFNITTQEEMIDRIKMITNVLTVLLTSIAAISLIVGGIGIMNIMLVSVTERTREIGLRKAVGATEKNILTQFLIESVVLTALGGIIGIILGVAFSYLASLAISKALGSKWDFVLSIPSIFLGLGVAGFVGLVFGLYPARRASLKDPIEALRYE